MHFTVEAQRIASKVLSEGDIAIDATCGNGHDTLFLAERVGASGVVYGIDIQKDAIKVAQQKLADAGVLERCRLVTSSHANLETIVAPEHMGRVSVVMLNLGYLPFGDKNIVTKSDSTLAALDQSLKFIRPGGLLSVLAYPGHPGGQVESNGVREWILDRSDMLDVDHFQDSNNARSPILWVLTVRLPRVPLRPDV